MTTKTVAAIIIAAALAGSAAALQFDQDQRRSADAASLQATTADDALFHLRLNALPYTLRHSVGVVYLTR